MKEYFITYTYELISGKVQEFTCVICCVKYTPCKYNKDFYKEMVKSETGNTPIDILNIQPL